MDKKRVTASERDAILRLCAAMAIIGVEPEHLKQRLADMPYSNRDIGLMRKSISKIIKHLMQSIPESQVNSIRRDIHNTTYTISIAKTTATETQNEKNAIMSLSYDTIYTLIEGCHDKCLMCDLDSGQRRACKLKKALDNVPNNISDKDNGDCPYYGVI